MKLNPDPDCNFCKGTGLYDACCRPHACECNNKLIKQITSSKIKKDEGIE